MKTTQFSRRSGFKDVQRKLGKLLSYALLVSTMYGTAHATEHEGRNVNPDQTEIKYSISFPFDVQNPSTITIKLGDTILMRGTFGGEAINFLFSSVFKFKEGVKLNLLTVLNKSFELKRRVQTAEITPDGLLLYTNGDFLMMRGSVDIHTSGSEIPDFSFLGNIVTAPSRIPGEERTTMASLGFLGHF